MRWHSKQHKRINENDIRVKEKFLLFPKCIDDEWRWFEKVKYSQKFLRSYFYYNGERYYKLYWEDIEWLN